MKYFSRQQFMGASLMVAVVVLAVSTFNWWARDMARPPLNRWNCLINLKNISRATSMYRVDYDGRFFLNRPDTPPGELIGSSRNEMRGWTRELQPYVKSGGIYRCPASESLRIDYDNGYTDYWFNQNLRRVSWRDVVRPAATFLIGEGADGTDKGGVTYSLKAFPPAWPQDTRMPPYRHMGGANYIFVDGHAAWLTPDKALLCDWTPQ